MECLIQENTHAGFDQFTPFGECVEHVRCHRAGRFGDESDDQPQGLPCLS